MNPLTLVKRIQSINAKEATLGISEDASWHAKYKDSAYVYVGGIPFDLTEGDLLAVFAQYGEIVDVNLVRDKGTGKSKGFAFVAYEDQRSTTLAVDNLNGAQILGRTVRVDHVSKYKKKEVEDEEEAQKKREERGVCRAFQKGECTRGAGCKFSHDEQRAANTGWGADNKPSTWGHDKYEDPQNRGPRGVCRDFQKGKCTRGAGCKFSHDDQRAANRSWGADDKPSSGGHDENEGQSKRDGRSSFKDKDFRRPSDRSASDRIDEDNKGSDRRSDRKEKGTGYDEDRDRHDKRKRSAKYEGEPTSRDDHRREETRSSRHKSESYTREDRDKRDYFSHRHNREDEDYKRKSDK